MLRTALTQGSIYPKFASQAVQGATPACCRMLGDELIIFAPLGFPPVAVPFLALDELLRQASARLDFGRDRRDRNAWRLYRPADFADRSTVLEKGR